MIEIIKESLWKQFGATIDMLKNAIHDWPEERWYSDKKFFYIAYHTCVFLDYYLSIPPTNFSPALPFHLTAAADIPAEAIDDLVPARYYSKEEILDYLQQSREKCRQRINRLTAESLHERFIEELDQGSMDFPTIEILLYNMRHVQHHAAQLNLFLRQHTGKAPGWVGRALDD